MNHDMEQKLTRRGMLWRGMTGLAAVGAAGVAGMTGLTLRADAEPTPASGELGDYGGYLAAEEAAAPAGRRGAGRFEPTESNILGPFHRRGAPYRGKITPPLAEGVTLLIRGRVWSAVTRQPLAGALLDIWQADHRGRYDNDDPRNPPAKGVFKNRARLLADEQGIYEYETIMPGHYRIAPEVWRPAHIHYLVRAPRHQQLVTQLYFKGDPHNATDRFIRESLIIELNKVEVGKQHYMAGTFDIVLAGA